MNHLKALAEVERELSLLSGIGALLHFDRATIMPKAGLEERGEQLSFISKRVHELRISKEFQECIRTLSSQKLSGITKDQVAKHERDLKKLINIPPSHVEEFSKLIILSGAAWEEARAKKDFSHFLPFLQKVTAMKIKEAKFIDPKKHPYNVLLDNFEEGMTIEELKPVFDELKTGLIEIIQRIKSSPSFQNKPLILTLPASEQVKITHDIKNRILPMKDRNLIATSVHPFTTRIGPDDVRITTAYREGQPLFSFTSTCHEAGHALYELQLDKKLINTSLYDAPSMGIHESQSRIWENQICKSNEFWQFYFPFLKKKNQSIDKVSFDDFFHSLNSVKESLIRIECDEVTYCLHIIIRFELEIALLEGTLKVKDLPAAWRKKYQEYLHVTPSDDAEGVLQDMHWSEGLFGYFPTYALGTMYSAMLFTAMKKSIPSLNKEIAKGNFVPIQEWLKDNVHKHGARMFAKDIIKKATGKEITPLDFLEYLKEKYYPLYGIVANFGDYSKVQK